MAAITIVNRPMILYTEAETAKILRVSMRTLQRWREIGVGPAFTQPRKGGRIVYSDKTIEDYVATRTFRSTAAADAEGAPVAASGVRDPSHRKGGRRRNNAAGSQPAPSTDLIGVQMQIRALMRQVHPQGLMKLIQREWQRDIMMRRSRDGPRTA